MIYSPLRPLYTGRDGREKNKKRCGCGQSQKMALMHALCCHAMVQIVLRCVEGDPTWAKGVPGSQLILLSQRSSCRRAKLSPYR